MEKLVKLINICYNSNERGGSNMNGVMSIANICDDVIRTTKREEKSPSKIMTYFSIFNSIRGTKSKLKQYDFSGLLETNSDVLNGQEVIKGTRITPKHLFDHMYSNISKFNQKEDINTFFQKLLVDYPSITEEQYVSAVLYYIKKAGYFELLNRK